MRDFKILGSGAAIVDILAQIDDSFIPCTGGEKGGMVMLDTQAADQLIARLPHYSRALGGSTGNTLFGLLRLGAKAAMLAKTGLDNEGKFYRSSFQGLGGDVSSFKTSAGKHTGRCISMITPDSARTMRTELGASSDLQPCDVSDADFNGITHLHAEGYQLFSGAYFDRLMELAEKHKVTLSLDLASYEIVNIFHDRIESLLRNHVDVVFANEDETAAFFRTADPQPEDSVKAFLELCGTAVVKVGAKGAYLGRRGEKTVFVPAQHVKAIDTTGAGDLWQAGFLYGYLNGYPLEICGKMGAVLGAEVVQVIGAAIPETRWPEINRQFNSLKGTI